MDRTNEFRKILKTKNIQCQKSTREEKTKTFFSEILLKLETGDYLLKEVEKISPYEKYNIHSKMVELKSMLKEIDGIQVSLLSMPSGHGSSGESYDKNYTNIVENIKSHVKIKQIDYNLRFNKIKRRLGEVSASKAKNAALNDTERQQKAGGQHELMIQEEEKGIVTADREIISERNKMVKRISEIGEVFEDIYLHANLQEEQLRRIDDTVAKSVDWSKKAFDDLEATWKMVKSNRGWLKIFLVFWILVVFFYWISRTG